MFRERKYTAIETFVLFLQKGEEVLKIGRRGAWCQLNLIEFPQFSADSAATYNANSACQIIVSIICVAVELLYSILRCKRSGLSPTSISFPFFELLGFIRHLYIKKKKRKRNLYQIYLLLIYM